MAAGWELIKVYKERSEVRITPVAMSACVRQWSLLGWLLLQAGWVGDCCGQHIRRGGERVGT